MSLDQPPAAPTPSVAVTGPGAVGVGGDNHGPITTTIHHTYLPAPGSARRDWRSTAVGALLGVTVGGGAVTILSGDYRWRLVIVVAATGLVLAVPTWLSRYPPRSALTRWATKALLIGATVGIVFAGFGPPLTVPWAIATATLLTTGAVLIPAHPETRLRLLLGAAGIALGVAAAGMGTAALAHHDRLFGAAGIALGVAIAGAGAAILAHHDRLGGAALIAVGVAFAGGGAAILADHDRLIGAASIALGVAIAGGGAAILAHHDRLIGAASIALGVAAAGGGAAILAHHDRLIGAASIAGGVTAVWYGAAILAHHDRLIGAASIAGGVAAAWYGARLLLDNGTRRWLRHRWAALITDPTTIEDPPTPHTRQTDHRP